MLKSADGGLRAVPFPVNDPERIPAQRYYDPEFYQAEVDHLWPHVWQMACRLEQIAKVGDWIEYHNLGKSVLVVNTKNGIKAFHNACRHRGVPIAGGKGNEHGNCGKAGFICPFHGWRWNSEGENTFIYGRHLFSDRQLEPDEMNLRECRVETWGGCAFINHDDDAPSLRDCLGPVAQRIEAHGVDTLRAEWCYGTVLPANWKVAMEAFMEGYHVMKTHPQLHAAAGAIYNSMYGASPTDMTATDSVQAARTPVAGVTTKQAVDAQFKHLELLSEGMAGMVHGKEIEIARQLLDVDLPEDPGEGIKHWFGMLNHQITEQLRANGEPVPDLNAVAMSDPINAVEFLFPHYFLLPMFSSMSAYRIRPLGPESCYFEIWSLTQFPEGQEPPPVMDNIVLPYDSEDFPPIPRQDYSNIPIQQQGMHATGFDYMRLSKEMEGLISNFERLLDGYLAGVPSEKLAKANHLLGGNFDGKIEDLGF